MINDQLSFNQFKFSKDQREKIIKLSRGVNKEVFKKKEINKDFLRKKYGILKNQKVIFFCGRVHELKRVIHYKNS